MAAKVITIPSGSEAGVMKEIDMCRYASIFHSVQSLFYMCCPCRAIQHPNILCVLGSVMMERKIAIITNMVRGSNLHELIFNSSTKVFGKYTNVYTMSHNACTCVTHCIVLFALYCRNNTFYLQLTFMLRKTVAVQIAQAIAFLHSTTPITVHLDVKPANILVSRSLISYLLYFHFIFFTLIGGVWIIPCFSCGFWGCQSVNPKYNFNYKNKLISCINWDPWVSALRAA